MSNKIMSRGRAKGPRTKAKTAMHTKYKALEM